jgi:hypothetical protein
MMSHQDQISSDDPAYARRMRLVQRWRRIALLVSLLLCVDAGVTVWLDPALAQPSHVALLQSLFAFIIALIVAVNFMAFRLRK